MSGDFMEYQFGDMEMVNAEVRKRLSDFSSTLADYSRTVQTMFGSWGGNAAAASGVVSAQLEKQGQEIRALVERYLKALEENLAQSQHIEKVNTNLFA